MYCIHFEQVCLSELFMDSCHGDIDMHNFLKNNQYIL